MSNDEYLIRRCRKALNSQSYAAVHQNRSCILLAEQEMRKPVLNDLSNLPQRPARRHPTLKTTNDGSAAQSNTAEAAKSTNNRSCSSNIPVLTLLTMTMLIYVLLGSRERTLSFLLPFVHSTACCSLLIDHLTISDRVSIHRTLSSLINISPQCRRITI